MGVSKIKMGRTTVYAFGGAAVFIPVGDVVEVGDTSEWYTKNFKENPFRSKGVKDSQGARIFLGFNIGVEEKVKIEKVIDLVFELRKDQVNGAINDGDAKEHPDGGDIGASFLLQKGLWQKRSDDKAYPENGVQIVIENIIHEKKSRFRLDMIEIAEALVTKFKQQAVILHLSKNGIIVDEIEVFP